MGGDGAYDPVPVQVYSRKEEGAFELEVAKEEGYLFMFKKQGVGIIRHVDPGEPGAQEVMTVFGAETTNDFFYGQLFPICQETGFSQSGPRRCDKFPHIIPGVGNGDEKSVRGKELGYPGDYLRKEIKGVAAKHKVPGPSGKGMDV
jgi:hypothetical protein